MIDRSPAGQNLIIQNCFFSKILGIILGFSLYRYDVKNLRLRNMLWYPRPGKCAQTDGPGTPYCVHSFWNSHSSDGRIGKCKHGKNCINQKRVTTVFGDFMLSDCRARFVHFDRIVVSTNHAGDYWIAERLAVIYPYPTPCDRFLIFLKHSKRLKSL